ncbi:MAG: S8 family serine peptidase [Xanthomonadaceae bacterium]|nr:S8 family serine peptidase [Xanthomonadaceae bacterium]
MSLPLAFALAVSACGGGGGGGTVRSDPPPPIPTGPGFTPTVANDASLVVSPPSVPTLGAPLTFTDPAINKHLSLTNAAGALGAGLRGQGVTIGLVDSGVNRNHPTMTGKVTASFVHVDPNANNTSVDDVVGHGTTVASLAAGRPATGTYAGGELGNWGGGVAQSANIVSSRIISDAPPKDDGTGAGNEIHAGQGYGDFFKSINGELADAGARIINNSWGGLYWNDPALTVELATAWKDFVVNRGGIVVFANGNSGSDPRYLGNPSDNARLPTLAADPQLEKGWLTVGALDPANPTQLTSYSQQCGTAMNYCLVAPGNVVFIDPQAKVGDASYKLYQGGGTSYAAPLVSGAAAVVWSAFPYFSNDQVRQALLGGAKDLGAPGVDAVFGWGLLDVTKAAMGPSNFAWGDFSVSFSGNSVWRNEIIGSGGLIKNGSGTLTLTEAGRFTGATTINAGALDVRKGLVANLAIADGATVWGSGVFAGNVNNAGRFLGGASVPASISGNFVQASTGNLGVWLGSSLRVTGTASLNGTMSILGVRSGYTTTARETLLNAAGGVSGTFSSLKAASNVFLDAALGYDPNNVFLNINRIDVSKAVAGMGLEGISLASAARVESAMQAIDGQLGGVAPGGIGASFIQAAGAFQQTATAAQADVSLRSLSGELHGASAALTLQAIDAGRRTVAQRVDALMAVPARAGGWYRDLANSGQWAQSGFDVIGQASNGEMIGNDWRIGTSTVLGLGMNKSEQTSWLGALGDRSRGHQREVQVYAAHWQGPWQAQAQWANGSFQRQLQRTLLLGDVQDTVATQLSGRYQAAYVELGRQFRLRGLSLTPYAGSQFVRVSNAGFDEGGETGFGLRANAWDASRWQGVAGLRAEQDWRLGGALLRADAHAEWQHTWAARGFAFDASYSGLSQWASLQGMDLGGPARSVGMGLGAVWPNASSLRLDLSRQSDGLGAGNRVSLLARWRF